MLLFWIKYDPFFLNRLPGSGSDGNNSIVGLFTHFSEFMVVAALLRF